MVASFWRGFNCDGMTGGFSRGRKGTPLTNPPLRIGVMLSKMSTKQRSHVADSSCLTPTRKYLPAPRFVFGSASGQGQANFGQELLTNWSSMIGSTFRP